MRRFIPKPDIIVVIAVLTDIILSIYGSEYRSGELSSIAIASYFAFISNEGRD